MTKSTFLGASIKKFRLEAGIGLREFAKQINIPANTLSQIENGGIKTPNDDTIDQILTELAKKLCKDKEDLMLQCGTITDEIADYFTHQPKAAMFLRRAVKKNLDESYWERLDDIDDLK